LPVYAGAGDGQTIRQAKDIGEPGVADPILINGNRTRRNPPEKARRVRNRAKRIAEKSNMVKTPWPGDGMAQRI